MQTVNWNDLQDFLAIARTGQLSRAADAIGVDATTMGRRLRRLETRLGRTLFEQTRQGQVLTEAGEAILAEVEAMEQAAARINEGRSEGEGPVGTLRVSLSEGFGSWFVADKLTEFVEGHPRLVIDLAMSSGFLSPSKREADVAIVLSRPRAGPLIAGKLSDYSLRLYASPEYLQSHGKPETITDLATHHRLVGYVPDMLFAPELRYLNRLHPDLEPSLRSTSINAQHRLIAAGAGMGVLPCFIGDRDPALEPVLPENRINGSFWLVTHKDTHQLARVQAFRNWLTRTVRRHRDQLLPA
ncbi:LysR family transcriptional regulator [Croceicoccus ponticola]|uniref:LysR family transcriptional regulator n=1 Tax=Croceicoccus ponticola TaxID=2217664 RepID=A0A437GZ21_9SPHN|nr:LysR family transcriptional regulator [Croceicoccus ponticola]RVQ67136.1 LysR family transcriptional regulator [Croceicoccus ponticola]